MKTLTTNHSNLKQAVLPLFISDYLDICDPVLVFDRFMEEIDLEKYLENVPEHLKGRLRYNPTNMLKTVLFGFMSNGYISLRELADNCKVNLRYMYLMEHQTPSYRTFGYFINNILSHSIEELFCDINKKIFSEEHVDLSHLYIDGSKFEANANKYSWVWKKATEKFRYKLYSKITALFNEMNEELSSWGIRIDINTEYVPAYLKEVRKKYAAIYAIDESKFVHGIGHIEEKEILRCPAGQAFHLRYRKNVKGNLYGRQEEIYQCENCTGCPYAAKCKRTDKNRTIRLNQELTSMHQEVIDNLENIHGALLRMNRSIQSEGTFGIIKSNRWYARIVRKGIKRVRLEIFLVSIGHNLYKY